MFQKYESNFYIRKDNENLYWSGLSVNTQNEEYISYKLSCFISKKNNGTWKAERTELIIIDRQSNMYRISNYSLSQLYNPNAEDKEILYIASLSRAQDDYAGMEPKNIYLNELFLKRIIDELKIKTEHSFGIKISI